MCTGTCIKIILCNVFKFYMILYNNFLHEFYISILRKWSMNELMIWNTCMIFVITVWKHDLFKYMYFYSPKSIWHIWQCVTVKKKLKVESLTLETFIIFQILSECKDIHWHFIGHLQKNKTGSLVCKYMSTGYTWSWKNRMYHFL